MKPILLDILYHRSRYFEFIITPKFYIFESKSSVTGIVFSSGVVFNKFKKTWCLVCPIWWRLLMQLIQLHLLSLTCS